MKRIPSIAVASGLLLASAPMLAGAGAGHVSAASGLTRQVAFAGTASPLTGEYVPSGSGDATHAEFPGQPDNPSGPAPFTGTIIDRSLASGSRRAGDDSTGRDDVKKAKSNPTFTTGFEGLNIYQQRYARGGNQFTIEPPDQGLCVGGGFVVEAVNDVMNVYNAAGQSLLPDNTATNIVAGAPRNVNHAVDLNSFFGYAPAIIRKTGVRAQSITDPSCLYDAATKRFYLVVLTLESTPTGALTQVNHLDVAVSKTPDPTGPWSIYKIDVTNDGTNSGGVNPGPYLGDYPHIGADASGFYITTNAYPWNSNGFAGAQIYAMSKRQLAAGASNLNVVHLDTYGLVNAPSDAGATQPGFTVWPAQSPGTESFESENGGTEYFLSSNAADEATHPVAGFGGNYTSSQIVQWTLTQTSSLDSANPSVSLSTKLLATNQYAIPPRQKQKGAGGAPGANAAQGTCINDTTTQTVAGTGCWNLLFAVEPAHNEVISTPDSNDTRMQQVTLANGKLWGALDTAINPNGGPQRAGVAWYIVNPSAGKMIKQGYLGAAGYDLTYPAIGVTASGRGVMALTATGDTLYPSAAYAAIDAKAGVSQWNVVPGGTGAAPEDGFTSYSAQVGSPPRTRWGDYGAAAVDGKSIWIASQYVAHACSYTDWGGPFFAGGSGDNLLGTCGGANHGPGGRTALANWSTRISQLTP